QNWRDLPMDIPLDRIEVLRYDIKGVKVRMGIMLTKTELTLEPTQRCLLMKQWLALKLVERMKSNDKDKDRHHGPSDAMYNPPPTTQDAPVMRTTSAAAKPCQGDSSEFYLITGNPDGGRSWFKTSQDS
ncbi:hypothetical protein Tco_0649864, partial [Tanacetum coccineum]